MTQDALEIANLKARYCLAADLAAGDEVAARALFKDCFTADFVGDYGFGTLEGEQVIADFMCTAIAGGSEWMVHMLGSPHILVSEDTATGEWTIQAESRRRDAGGRMTVIGRYKDSFRRTDDGWRLASITFQRFE